MTDGRAGRPGNGGETHQEAIIPEEEVPVRPVGKPVLNHRRTASPRGTHCAVRRD